MQSLYDKLYKSDDFLIGAELVSIRGSMAEEIAVKARTFANELIDCSEIDWISITDNAGGNPQLAPQALGKPILYAGKEVVIHLTCKDMNRNGLESEAWSLNSEGFHNILAMTGDYPIGGNEGRAKPVFDIDSVGLISMLSQMNKGFHHHYGMSNAKPKRLEKTSFNIGAVTTNFKLLEGEVMPQYHKLKKKVECGAHFIINQIGYDSRKQDELKKYMEQHGMKDTPLIGNTYVLNPRVAKIFHSKKIPGVVVSDELLDLCLKQGASPDKGKTFFYEFAAKQMAIFKGLGYKGVYLGGVDNFYSIDRVLEIERSFSPDDWKIFVKEIRYSRPNEFYYYTEEKKTGLSNITKRDLSVKGKNSSSISYAFSKWMHKVMFTKGKPVAKMGASACKKSKNPKQGPKLLRSFEHFSKRVMFDCKDCGDCSLYEIAFLCPESVCAKNQRNGPCGGTKEGKCEVAGYGDCIWLQAYERLKHDGKEDKLLEHSPVVQDQGLRGTSSWANHWLGKDHYSKKYKEAKISQTKVDVVNNNHHASNGMEEGQPIKKEENVN
mgnify:CR=1 FL=1